MSPHRRNTPWREEIDPALNRTIRRFIQGFREMCSHSEEGFLHVGRVVTEEAQEDMLFVWNTVSMLTHRKTLPELYAEAKMGDDASLFKLIRVMKSMLSRDWVKTRIERAMETGDAGFFASLGKAVAEAPLNLHYDDLEIALVLVRFWESGLNQLTVHQARQLLIDSGINFRRGDCSFNHVRVRLKPFLKSRDILRREKIEADAGA